MSKSLESPPTQQEFLATHAEPFHNIFFYYVLDAQPWTLLRSTMGQTTEFGTQHTSFGGDTRHTLISKRQFSNLQTYVASNSVQRVEFHLHLLLLCYWYITNNTAHINLRGLTMFHSYTVLALSAETATSFLTMRNSRTGSFFFASQLSLAASVQPQCLPSPVSTATLMAQTIDTS